MSNANNDLPTPELDAGAAKLTLLAILAAGLLMCVTYIGYANAKPDDRSEDGDVASSNGSNAAEVTERDEAPVARGEEDSGFSLNFRSDGYQRVGSTNINDRLNTATGNAGSRNSVNTGADGSRNVDGNSSGTLKRGPHLQAQ